MKLSAHLCLALILGFVASAVYAAEPPKPVKEKSPGDLAAEAFFKLRDDKEAPPTPERLTNVMAAGITFLKTYPMHGRASGVINSLATFGTTMKDTKEKKMGPQRTAWLSKLQYEALVHGGADDLAKAAPEALKALAAATAGVLAKEAPTQENVADFREKIDRLAAMPEAARFQVEQERAFIQLLKQMRNIPMAERLTTKLLASTDKKMAAMAQEELNMINITKQPLALTFPTLDGKTVDVATLVGKPVCFFFWATTHEGSLKEIDGMQEGLASLPKNKFEVILVNCDKAENRDAVEKYIKKNRLKNSVWFTGNGMENELGAKANVTKLPATLLFDAKGMFVSKTDKFQGTPAQLKKLLGVK